MSTSAYLPVGTVGNVKTTLINKGDEIMVDGNGGPKLYTFIEMKVKYFLAKEKSTGVTWKIPKWRLTDRMPAIIKKTGKTDKSVFGSIVKKNGLKYGDLFALDGKKETFMFLENTTKRTGKSVMKAINLSDNTTFTIGEGFVLKKVNLAKIKRENKVTA